MFIIIPTFFFSIEVEICLCFNRISEKILQRIKDCVKYDKIDQMMIHPDCKGTFFSERTDFFVITPNRRTFFFPETENLNFDDF